MLYKKMIVEVEGKFTKEGEFYPSSLILEDGSKFCVDRVKNIARRAAMKVGGTGIRYTVMILGQEKYLFREKDIWFVEAKCE